MNCGNCKELNKDIVMIKTGKDSWKCPVCESITLRFQLVLEPLQLDLSPSHDYKEVEEDLIRDYGPQFALTESDRKDLYELDVDHEVGMLDSTWDYQIANEETEYEFNDFIPTGYIPSKVRVQGYDMLPDGNIKIEVLGRFQNWPI